MFRAPRTSRRAGFSLIELMVVIAIMGLLATVVAVNLMGRTYEAKVKKVMADFDAMKKAIQLFKLDSGRYPTQLADLWQSPGGAKNWKGPYIDASPKDPWGNDYVYTAPVGGSTYIISSYGELGGPGGAAGTEQQTLTTQNITTVQTNGGN
jgi:general secretion pathway protein G